MKVWLPKNWFEIWLRYLPAVKEEESFLSERKETVEGLSEVDIIFLWFVMLLLINLIRQEIQFDPDWLDWIEVTDAYRSKDDFSARHDNIVQIHAI